MNCGCPKKEIPAAVRKLADWCEGSGMSDRITEAARDLREVWSEELLDESGDDDMSDADWNRLVAGIQKVFEEHDEQEIQQV
jgi:hypothetical protein